MPIALHQFTAGGAAAQPGYLAAKELARQCVDQYTLNLMLGPGGGIAAASCWAALAVTPNGVYHAPMGVNAGGPPGTGAGWGALPYAMTFGNSRMSMINALVPVPGFGGGGHAERTALIAAGAAGCFLYPLPAAVNSAVLFVQLSPCGPCGVWLGGGGGGVANPYTPAIAGGVTLHVWYRWPHPAGVGAMIAWNGNTRAAKLADITANW